MKKIQKCRCSEKVHEIYEQSLILALVLSSIGVWTYVRKNMTGVDPDKYEFMNEKMGISLDSLYRKSDTVTAEIILDDNVQKS